MVNSWSPTAANGEKIVNIHFQGLQMKKGQSMPYQRRGRCSWLSTHALPWATDARKGVNQCPTSGGADAHGCQPMPSNGPQMQERGSIHALPAAGQMLMVVNPCPPMGHRCKKGGQSMPYQRRGRCSWLSTHALPWATDARKEVNPCLSRGHRCNADAHKIKWSIHALSGVEDAENVVNPRSSRGDIRKKR
jgi:hypothetical protein